MAADDRLRVQRYRDANIPPVYLGCTFETFMAYNESLQRARAQVQDFAKDVETATKGLFLSGGPGVGKSHLAVSALKVILDDAPSHAVFHNTAALIREVAMKPTAIVAAIDPNIVVLDDIGAQQPSALVDDILGQIIGSRYEARSLTIFTSNYYDTSDEVDPDALRGRLGAWLHSRVSVMSTFIDLQGLDYRRVPAGQTSADALTALWAIEEQRRPRRTWPWRRGGNSVEPS